MHREFVSHPITLRVGCSFTVNPVALDSVANPVNTVSFQEMQENTLYCRFLQRLGSFGMLMKEVIVIVHLSVVHLRECFQVP